MYEEVRKDFWDLLFIFSKGYNQMRRFFEKACLGIAMAASACTIWACAMLWRLT